MGRPRVFLRQGTPAQEGGVERSGIPSGVQAVERMGGLNEANLPQRMSKNGLCASIILHYQGGDAKRVVIIRLFMDIGVLVVLGGVRCVDNSCLCIVLLALVGVNVM